MSTEDIDRYTHDIKMEKKNKKKKKDKQKLYTHTHSYLYSGRVSVRAYFRTKIALVNIRLGGMMISIFTRLNKMTLIPLSSLLFFFFAPMMFYS